MTRFNSYIYANKVILKLRNMAPPCLTSFDLSSIPLCDFYATKGGYFQKLSQGSETLDMTSERIGNMFRGNFADM